VKSARKAAKAQRSKTGIVYFENCEVENI